MFAGVSDGQLSERYGSLGRSRLRLKRLVVLSLTALSLPLASPALAGRRATTAGCGGVVSVGASGWHRSYRAPLAIGDSTMLLALPELSREGFSVNAHGCRQYPEALSLLRSLRDAHELPRLVVVALGANGGISDGDVTGALQILGPERLLVLVTPRELGGGSGSDAQLVRAEGLRHPQRVRVLDWVAYSAAHRSWFEPDGLHLSPGGSAALAQFIGGTRPLAAPPRSVRTPRCPSSTPLSPSAPLTGVSLSPSGGTLRVYSRSSRLGLRLVNANSFVVEGVARLAEAAGRGRTIAASCVSVPPGADRVISFELDAAARADLELVSRIPVRVELSLTAPPNLEATASSTYSLEQARR
jgi:hypothetical protein